MPWHKNFSGYASYRGLEPAWQHLFWSQQAWTERPRKSVGDTPEHNLREPGVTPVSWEVHVEPWETLQSSKVGYDAGEGSGHWTGENQVDSQCGKEGTPTIHGLPELQCLKSAKNKTVTYSYLSSCSSGSPAAWLPVPRGNEKYYNSLSCLHSLFLDELFPTGALDQGFLPPSGLLPARARGQPYLDLIGGELGGLWPKKVHVIGSVLRPESPSWQIHCSGLRLQILIKSKFPPCNFFHLPKHITHHWCTCCEWVYHILSREHKSRVNKSIKLREQNGWEETDGLGQFPLVSYEIIAITVRVTLIDHMWSHFILLTTLVINAILQNEKTELQGVMQIDQGPVAGKGITKGGARPLHATPPASWRGAAVQVLFHTPLGTRPLAEDLAGDDDQNLLGLLFPKQKWQPKVEWHRGL